MVQTRSRVIVIGSGIAGLIAAVEASRNHSVILITKSNLAESNTHYAQGGIAAVVTDDDTVAEHVTDTLVAGAGLCWPEAVNVLCAEGPGRINDLVALGVEFDRQGETFARGLEAAHSHPRILHAGGDATGAGISNALVAAVRATSTEIYEHTFLVDIATEVDADGRKKVIGVHVFDTAGTRFIEADTVILASGGAGQLYRHTTNPAVTTGDGVAAALRAGAVLSDVEFYQFHPTALAVPGSFLISEAVRGEGAVLINAAGERFMKNLHPLAELAPRDIVARGIQAQMMAQGGQPVLLDATALGESFLSERFPSITAACRSYGLNWATAPIPVTPAAHYWMGGVATDSWGRTSIPGLYAVGEVACTGAHGANRLASNSLLESIVFSHRAVSHLGQPWPEDAPAARWGAQGPLLELELTDHLTADAPAATNDADAARRLATQVVDRVELQTMMWDNVGLARTRTELESTLEQIRGWRPADPAHRLFPDWEDANLLLLAQALTQSALARHESRGGHYRLDYPETSPALARPITIARKV
ncbi:L-aspartate oxidase [Alpinimonas psychrophila]|uniref:L-aspartate oxidase n=1 Tax=Alpinimonas psychrophila TaxID=748908 RepID=A0A7W3JRY6_9MICO|nr:L-aspartate oxidase [Alpinimonas psychrophila]MBA8828156.1 L-aspartate oxidase [Alpinimonas psychrophila]